MHWRCRTRDFACLSVQSVQLLPIHIYICKHKHTYTYTYIHIHTYTYIYIHIHTHTYRYIHIHTYTYIYIHMHTYTYIYIHIYIHIYMYQGPTAEGGRVYHLTGGLLNALRRILKKTMVNTSDSCMSEDVGFILRWNTKRWKTKSVLDLSSSYDKKHTNCIALWFLSFQNLYEKPRMHGFEIKDHRLFSVYAGVLHFWFQSHWCLFKYMQVLCIFTFDVGIIDLFEYV